MSLRKSPETMVWFRVISSAFWRWRIPDLRDEDQLIDDRLEALKELVILPAAGRAEDDSARVRLLYQGPSRH
jgi:hypothetical protein